MQFIRVQRGGSNLFFVFFCIFLYGPYTKIPKIPVFFQTKNTKKYKKIKTVLEQFSSEVEHRECQINTISMYRNYATQKQPIGQLIVIDYVKYVYILLLNYVK
eukprot:sb/3478209/